MPIRRFEDSSYVKLLKAKIQSYFSSHSWVPSSRQKITVENLKWLLDNLPQKEYSEARDFVVNAKKLMANLIQYDPE